MRIHLISILSAAAMAASSATGSFAAPINGDIIVGAAPASSLVQQARVFCYNSYTGRFLHWGSCGHYYVHHYYYHPRVYCYNRYSGRFLHWGRC